LSVVAVVAAAIGSLVLMETATIKMSVPTSRVVAEKTIIGAQSGRDLTTARIAADVTDTQQGTATTAVTSPTYATGTVQFTCSPCPADGIPVGTVVSTAAGTRYETQLRGPIGPPNNGVSVLVRAVLAGKAGNTAANTVTMIVPPMPNVKVTNAAAITGGADAVVNTGITQSDLDSVRSALAAKVTQELIVSLTVQAGGLNFAPDGQPDLAVTTDHKIGEKVATFTMTMEGKLGAVAFSESQADTIMRTTLGEKIPTGFKLTSDPIQTSYLAQHSGANGDLTLKGSATGVIVPSVTADELKARIKGMRVESARAQLERVAPGTTVDITVKPAVPWLPVLQDHINLTIVIETAATA